MMPMTIAAMISPSIGERLLTVGWPPERGSGRDYPARGEPSHAASARVRCPAVDREPVIITNSISGAVANRDQCPAIPYTPEEYAAEARRAVDEGAVMIHIHARDPRTGAPSFEVEHFRAITEAILGAVGDVIVNFSTGAVGVPVETRLGPLRALRPDVAALNMGSMNYAKYSRRRGAFVFDTVFENSFETILAFVREMGALGIRPEHECF